MSRHDEDEKKRKKHRQTMKDTKNPIQTVKDARENHQTVKDARNDWIGNEIGSTSTDSDIEDIIEYCCTVL